VASRDTWHVTVGIEGITIIITIMVEEEIVIIKLIMEIIPSL